MLSVSINPRRPGTAAISLAAGPPALISFANRSVRRLPAVEVGARMRQLAGMYLQH